MRDIPAMDDNRSKAAVSAVSTNGCSARLQLASQQRDKHFSQSGEVYMGLRACNSDWTQMCCKPLQGPARSSGGSFFIYNISSFIYLTFFLLLILYFSFSFSSFSPYS